MLMEVLYKCAFSPLPPFFLNLLHSGHFPKEFVLS